MIPEPPDCGVCARLLKNACMDLDEMLRDDRFRNMDELINFCARSGSQETWVLTRRCGSVHYAE